MRAETVDLAGAGWKDEGPGIRALVAQAAGCRWAVVEYGAGASRDEWCTDGHRGYVLSGAMEYAFDDGAPALRIEAGQGFVLPAGSGHRGRNAGGGPARIFLIDDSA